MEFNYEMWMGVMTILIIPALIWAWNIHSLAKATHDMHLEPDKYGFGNAHITNLLVSHMEEEESIQREAVSATKELRHAVRELSHYTRWAAKQSSGKEPPPYVRNGD